MTDINKTQPSTEDTQAPSKDAGVQQTAHPEARPTAPPGSALQFQAVGPDTPAVGSTDFFSRCFVVSLKERTKRLEEFYRDLPKGWNDLLPEPEAFTAIDGRKCRPPQWWKQPPGAWGCYRSHCVILEQMINEGWPSVLLMEDDAVCERGFLEDCREYLDNIPPDWDMVYLGGEHLHQRRGRPRRVNDWVYQPFNVNRTHAFGVSRRFAIQLYQWLHVWDQGPQKWIAGFHIDHHLGRIHERMKDRIYCPKYWLIGQRKGPSDISGKKFDRDRYWQSAESLAGKDPIQQNFYVILGLHSSGSSCLAGVCYHLGMYLGKKLVGYYGRMDGSNRNSPDRQCGFEAVGIRDICEKIIPFPEVKPRWAPGRIRNKLQAWINSKRKEGIQAKVKAGCKYPQLCQLGPYLQDILGDHLRVIISDRPVEDSIKSIIKRQPNMDPALLEKHQRWLAEGRDELAASLPKDQVLRVPYYSLLEDPENWSLKIADFCEIPIKAGSETHKAATLYVKPDHCHIGPWDGLHHAPSS